MENAMLFLITHETFGKCLIDFMLFNLLLKAQLFYSPLCWSVHTFVVVLKIDLE